MSAADRTDWGLEAERGLTGDQSSKRSLALHAGHSGEGWRAGLGKDVADLCFLDGWACALGLVSALVGAGAWVARPSLARMDAMKDERAGRGVIVEVTVLNEGEEGGGNGDSGQKKI